jgi:bacterioferritin-associated ferredoxin
MWICLCEAVTSGTIHEAIEDGATSLDDIAKANAAGTVCGRCKRNIAVLLNEHRARDRSGSTEAKET